MDGLGAMNWRGNPKVESGGAWRDSGPFVADLMADELWELLPLAGSECKVLVVQKPCTR